MGSGRAPEAGERRPSLSALLAERVVLLDGAMGTALVEHGLPVGTPPDLWNLERPDCVLAVHQSYIAAGSDVIQTNTFGASPLALARHGLEDRMAELNRAAVRIAREAAGAEHVVAGNLGPSGRLLAPLGDVLPSEVVDSFRRQALVLAEAGVDCLCIETMMDLAEARCALEAALLVGLPVTVCMTFERRQRGHFTLMGDRPEAAMRALAGSGATAVGANCSLGSGDMLAMVPSLLAGSEHVPLIVKPNAGLPETVAGRPVYRQEPAAFATDVARAVDLGARMVGGCCGTNAQHIAALRRELFEQ